MVDEAAVEVDLGSVGDDFVDDVDEDEDDEPDVTEEADVDDSGTVVATESSDACDVSLELVDDPHDAINAAIESATTQRMTVIFLAFMEFLRRDIYLLVVKADSRSATDTPSFLASAADVVPSIFAALSTLPVAIASSNSCVVTPSCAAIAAVSIPPPFGAGAL